MQNVLNSYTVPVATPTELSQLLTGRFQNGQQAFVQNVSPYGQLAYELSPPIGTVDNVNIIPTADDVTRQWVRLGLLSDSLLFMTEEFDLTTLQTLALAPGVNGKIFTGTRRQEILTVKGGALIAAPSSAQTFYTAAQFFTATLFAKTPPAYEAANFTGSDLVPVAGTPITFSTTIAATGTGLTYKGRHSVVGFYAPS